MRILIATSEIAPYSQSCEIADVCRALPKALRGLDHSVTVVSPLYQSVDTEKYSLARRLSTIDIDIGQRTFSCEIYDGRTSGGVDLLFVGNRDLFTNYAPTDCTGTESDAQRAMLFSRAVVEILSRAEPEFEVVQVHDWLAYLSIVLVKQQWPRLPVILTLHDLDRQGRFADSFDTIFESVSGVIETVQLSNERNLLKGGITWADTVVSPSLGHLEEVSATGRIGGLTEVFRSNRDKLISVVNGLDSAIWNPITDVHIRFRFDPNNLDGKWRCKAAFQHDLCLPIRSETPIIAMVTDGSRQQRLAIVQKIAGRLLRNDLQFAIVCVEDGEIPIEMMRLAERFADRLKILESADEALIHQTIASSDFFLIPFRSRSTAILQLSAHRYGTVPIVGRFGDFVDVVVDCDSSLQTGNGFVFEKEEPDELLATVRRAVAAYRQVKPFELLRQRAMMLDNSWDRTARRYDYLYKRIAPGEL